jgi:RNA polymerase sigma factor (sigma-70 family)
MAVVWPTSQQASRCPCNDLPQTRQVVSVHNSSETAARSVHRLSGPALQEFENAYRANFGAVTAFFARRCADPQTVLDLTSDTFVQAIDSLRRFDPGKGTVRAWLFGIARRVYAQHRALIVDGNNAAARYAGQRPLADDEIEELAARIDAERTGRELIERWSRLPELERAAIELVDLCGLPPREAAASLGVSSGALRVRLYRARTRLRNEEAFHG